MSSKSERVLRPHSPLPSTAPGGTLGSVGVFQLIERLPQRCEVREYVARQRGPGGFERLCLLKLASRTSEDFRAAESLEREAKLVMRFDHPNIVRFHDFFEYEDDVVLVLEHFSGLTLARLVELMRDKGQRLDERITWLVARSLFQALAHAHGVVDSAGVNVPIVHRDVRPENLLVASDGRVRLTGFAAAQDPDASAEITAHGAIVCVPSYVAPEQVRGGDATERSDAYAAALVVWELLTGRCATPEGLSEYDLLRGLSERQVEPLRTLRGEIPALVTTALDLCLRKDPEERRIRCSEVAGCIAAGLEAGDGPFALRECIAGLGPMVEKLAGGKAPSMPPPKRKPNSVSTLPHRPEVVTKPDPAEASKMREEAVTAVPAEPRPASERNAPRASDFEEDTTVFQPSSRPPEHSGSAANPLSDPAPAVVASTMPSARLEALSDGDLKELEVTQKRRRFVQLTVIGIPVAVTGVILLAALFGGVGGGTEDMTEPKTASITPLTTSSTTLHVAKPDPTIPSATPAKSALPPVPSDQAGLVVQGPPDGFVYVPGKQIGRTGQRILTQCGQRFVRVGTRTGPQGRKSVSWVAEGQSVTLKCGETLVIPARSTRKKRH
jgi:serine/threonine protein kinase